MNCKWFKNNESLVSLIFAPNPIRQVWLWSWSFGFCFVFFFLSCSSLLSAHGFGIYFSSRWEHSELWVASLETSCLKWSWGGNTVLSQRKREHLFSSVENKNTGRLDPGRVHLSPPPPPLPRPIFFPHLMVPKQTERQILHLKSFALPARRRPFDTESSIIGQWNCFPLLFGISKGNKKKFHLVICLSIHPRFSKKAESLSCPPLTCHAVLCGIAPSDLRPSFWYLSSILKQQLPPHPHHFLLIHIKAFSIF